MGWERWVRGVKTQEGRGWRDSLLPDDVQFLANFQVASGLEGESWLWVESNGVREEERCIREQGGERGSWGGKGMEIREAERMEGEREMRGRKEKEKEMDERDERREGGLV